MSRWRTQGKRPFRLHINPTHDGAEIVNPVLDRMREGMLQRVGLSVCQAFPQLSAPINCHTILSVDQPPRNRINFEIRRELLESFERVAVSAWDRLASQKMIVVPNDITKKEGDTR